VTLISALVVALLMLALSIVLLMLASPAATIVLRLVFLLPTVLAICGVLFLLRSPDPTRVRMNLRDVRWHILSPSTTRRYSPVVVHPCGAALRRSGRRVVRLLPLRCLVKGVRRVRDLLVAQNVEADVMSSVRRVLGSTRLVSEEPNPPPPHQTSSYNFLQIAGFSSAPGRIRTCDRRIRSPLWCVYPCSWLFRNPLKRPRQ
jgi:hypothetical protein